MNKRRRYKAKQRRATITKLMQKVGVSYRGARQLLEPSPYIQGIIRRIEVTFPMNSEPS